MKAITVEPKKAETAHLEEGSEPDVHEGSVLVEAIAVGVCGTDVEIVEGKYRWAPPGKTRLVLGHESLGRVLVPYAGKSPFPNHGQRVVNGYRLMQPASDIFLGWVQGVLDKRHYFIRQLRDIKISIRVESFGSSEMDLYATWCGRALALSHARAGSSILSSGYMVKSDTFDRAIADFSLAYADHAEKDHAALDRAVRKGKVKAVFEEAK